jgi:hypothetical protein
VARLISIALIKLNLHGKMVGWVRIYKSTNAIDAEMVKAMLIDQGIEAVVINKIDSSYLFGEASVYCKNEEEAMALAFINVNPTDIHE